MNIFVNCIGVCDHSASCTIWADSILDEHIFRAHYQCSSADDAYKKNCSPNYDDTYMGEITPLYWIFKMGFGISSRIYLFFFFAGIAVEFILSILTFATKDKTVRLS